MPRRKQLIHEMEGGGRHKKPNVAKAFKKLGRDIKKGFESKIERPIQRKIIKPTEHQFVKPAGKFLAKAGAELGDFTNKQLLPGLVSVAMPLVSTGIGALGAEFGIPPEISSTLSENLMKEFIPKQYQSDNKYVNLLSQGLNLAATGDPMAAMQLGQDTLGTVAGDIGKLTGKHKVKQQVPTSQYYDPEDPHADLMLQLMSQYQTIPGLQQGQDSSQEQDQKPETVQPDQNQQMIDYNALTDALYKGADIADDADSLTITYPPFQQREGSMVGLLGAGIKKRRGRPRKKLIVEDITEHKIKRRKPKKEVIKRVEIVHKLPYERFKHAENASLKQLLESHHLNEQKNLNKNVSDMANYIKNDVENVKRNMERLERERDFYREALGEGIGRPKKGSQEAKDKMAKLRAMKKK